MNQELEKAQSLADQNPDWGYRRLAESAGISGRQARKILGIRNREHRADGDSKFSRIKRMAAAGGVTPAGLAKSFGMSATEVEDTIRRLEEAGAVWSGHFLEFRKPEPGRLPLSFLEGGKPFKLGLVGDTHLASRFARLDALNLQYDLFQREGITTVLHAGNIVDGYIARINGGDLLAHGIDDQTHFCIDNYPKRPGINTYFITGDDHEGWWQKDGFNFGRHLELVARKEGRKDLHYIGHVEADVVLATPHGDMVLKIQHPGGGSAYARSYASQKIAESLEGGEKPHFLVLGHYHVASYVTERNIHIISLPGFQDQTIFGRKKRLRFEVGGVILTVHPTEAGTPGRVAVEFTMFYNRGFYKAFLRADDGRLPKIRFSGKR